MIHTLPNGLRIIHETSNSSVVYCGYVVCSGTRHEAPEESGMAHFVEHMTFKGTERRKACQVTGALERVGGDLNASTSKQETVYTAAVLKEDVARAVDLLSDIVFHSTFPQHEVEREVEVICDEIDSYLDAPAELIFDEFESMIYADAPLGRDILGNADTLKTYTTADFRRFVDKHYVPENCVFFAYGDVDPKRLIQLVEKATADVPNSPKPSVESLKTNYEPKTIIREKGTHQAHVVIGAPAFGANDDRRFGMLLLNNILGGPGMNSRLNMQVRERAGLVYSIDSYLSTYPDTGMWNVYFGCDPHDVNRCLKLVKKELRKLAEKPLTPSQLRAAQKQLKGQIGISCDNREGYALALGKTFAHYNVHRDVNNLYEEIDRLTPELLQEIAREVYAEDKLSTLIYK